MGGFAFHIAADGQAASVPIDEALNGDAALTWVHLLCHAEEAESWLRDAAGLEPYVVDALTATETRPRCEKVGEGALLNLRGRSKVELDSSDLLASVRIWAQAGRVFSVTRSPLYATAEVRGEVEAGDIRDPGDLITAFATAITEDLDPEVAQLGDCLDDCEESLDANRVFELRRQVTHVRVTAISYRRFVAPQRQALEKLATLPSDWLADDDRLHLAGAADRAARMAEELESIRERATLVHEALTDLRAEQIDSRSLLISAVALIFLPLTFLTGLYGMNVDLPFQHAPWMFDVIAGACVVIAVGVTAYFVRQHWFRG
jgi:zinc transporter